MTKSHPFIEAFMKGRFSAMLVSFILLFLAVPLFPGDQGSVDKISGVFVMIVLVSCLRAIARTRRFFVFMVLLSIVNVGVGSYELISDIEPHAFGALALWVRMLYFGIVFFSIMRYVLDDSPVTGDKICGAISAYMVMGITWTFIYGLFYHFNPASFDVPEALLSSDTVHSTWAFYFSFTTMTTLGYGDITPLTAPVQSYAIMQAAIGQIFLAVIIARLIALHITHERGENSD